MTVCLSIYPYFLYVPKHLNGSFFFPMLSVLGENKIFQFSQTLQKSFETIHSVPTYLKIGQHDLQINKLAATVPNLYRQKKKKSLKH